MILYWAFRILYVYQIHILLRFSPASELLLKRVGGIYEAQLQLSLTDDADSIWLYKVCSWSVYITRIS